MQAHANTTEMFIEYLMAKLLIVEADKREARHQLENIMKSKSWRFTEPFRGIVSSLKGTLRSIW